MDKLLLAVPLWLLNLLSGWWAQVHDFTDWSLFCWGLAGSTVYMIYEITEGKQRPRIHRFYLVLIGLFCALAFARYPIKNWSWDPVFTTALFGFFGYVALGPLREGVKKFIKTKTDALTTNANATTGPPDQP